ncbi:MAG: hypothetical protein AAGA03_18145 [Planctomycetota bacterium]
MSLVDAVHFRRSEHSWTEADSAAGFMLRYLLPVRRQLMALLGGESEADQALIVLIAHLVQAGFGNHNRGRLRDFLLRGVRSAARARRVDRAKASGSQTLPQQTDIDALTFDSPQWVGFWRDDLLQRTWRSLERFQHAEPGQPLYSLLKVATANPKEAPAVLTVRLLEEEGLTISEAKLVDLLPVARREFAQRLSDEIAETLQEPDAKAIKEEIKAVGLQSVFA